MRADLPTTRKVVVAHAAGRRLCADPGCDSEIAAEPKPCGIAAAHAAAAWRSAYPMTRPCRLRQTRNGRPASARTGWKPFRWSRSLVALVVYLPILAARTAHNLGDVQVFFRAAWAVWTGYPLYQVVDVHGWSYHYPPIFAILMGPFADPLPGYPGLSWALPFAVSVGVFYALSIAAMLLAGACLGKGARRPFGHHALGSARPAGGRCGSHRCCSLRPISAPRSRAASRPRSSSCSPACS